MPAELLLASVGAGKTETALARIAQLTQANPFAKVWILLATERQVSQFRNRLIEATDLSPVFFNIQFFTFPELYAHMLNAAGKPARQLSEPARLRLLRVLASRDRDALGVYGPIAHKPGFVRVLAGLIDELKGALIEPLDFAHATERVFQGRQKDQDIYRLYHAYQQRLQQHDIVDREGEGWLALAELLDDPTVAADVALLVVDGYDQFTALQAAIVAQIAGRIPDTLITLTDIPSPTSSIGRRFQRAKDRLLQSGTQANLYFTTRTLSHPIPGRHPDLQRLSEQFGLLATDTQPAPSDGGVRFLAAPDIPTEAAAVLRQVKKLLLGAATRPDDIMLVLRDPARYQVHLRELGRAYGLPLVLHMGDALGDAPPIRVLFDLITLHDTRLNLIDFPRRALLDVLQSPYIDPPGLDRAAIEKLTDISQEWQVVGGRAAWQSAIQNATSPRDADDDSDGPTRHPALITADERDHLLHALGAFFDHLTPPDASPMSGYIVWLEALIGCDPAPYEDDTIPPDERDGYLQLVSTLRRDVDEYIVTRDIAALDAFKTVLQGLLSADELLRTLEGTEPVLNWADFLADLRTAVEAHQIDKNPERHGHVLVTTATNARGLPHDHLFVLGLSEGIFPLRTTEDPLYLDSERVQLVAAGLPVETAADRAFDDGLFYELINLPRRTLRLSRPTMQNGSPWVASHLWAAVANLFTNANDLIDRGTIRVGEVPPIQDAPTAEDALIALAETFHGPADPAAVAAYNWFIQSQSQAWSAVWTGREIETRRMTDPSPPHNGIIQHPDLLATVKQLLSIQQHQWSVSQLNDYGTCPYRFFAGRVLALNPLEEPFVGLDARQLGTLNHNILEQTYRQLAADNTPIDPAHTDHALSLLHAAAAELFANAPRQQGFRASPMWEQEKQVILDRLVALVRYDFNEMNAHLADVFGVADERRPYAVEVRFGIGNQGRLITLPDGDTIKFTGMIDRIDRYGDQLVVIDYKTGNTPIPLKELQAGRNFQIMLYILAARHLLDAWRGENHPDVPRQVLGGFFWHIRNRTISGVLHANDPDHNALIQTAEHTLKQYVQQARAGVFPVKPSHPTPDGRCAAYCGFYRLCRVSLTQPATQK